MQPLIRLRAESQRIVRRCASGDRLSGFASCQLRSIFSECAILVREAHPIFEAPQILRSKVKRVTEYSRATLSDDC